jgi:restriction system protein
MRSPISPPGADGGVDILAAGGKLGLGEDRICVQVKSGDGAANHDVVLKLIGSVSNTQAQTGLLVSLGGVNSVAQKELDNNFFKLRLWQMSDLLKALYRTYNDLSDTTRAKLPLKQIWVPMVGGDV